MWQRACLQPEKQTNSTEGNRLPCKIKGHVQLPSVDYIAPPVKYPANPQIQVPHWGICPCWHRPKIQQRRVSYRRLDACIVYRSYVNLIQFWCRPMPALFFRPTWTFAFRFENTIEDHAHTNVCIDRALKITVAVWRQWPPDNTICSHIRFAVLLRCLKADCQVPTQFRSWGSVTILFFSLSCTRNISSYSL